MLQSTHIYLGITFRSYTQGGISPDKLSTISCILKSKFPVNEPPKPDLTGSLLLPPVFWALEITIIIC